MINKPLKKDSTSFILCNRSNKERNCSNDHINILIRNTLSLVSVELATDFCLLLSNILLLYYKSVDLSRNLIILRFFIYLHWSSYFMSYLKAKLPPKFHEQVRIIYMKGEFITQKRITNLFFLFILDTFIEYNWWDPRLGLSSWQTCLIWTAVL